MREIKFRAWCLECKEYIYYDSMEDIYSQGYICGVSCDLSRCIWEQYTGLKDKNEKDIYEGDIIDFYESGEKIGQGRVFYSEEYACFYHTYNEYISNILNVDISNPPKRFWCNYDIEKQIVGNIYENPELLNE